MRLIDADELTNEAIHDMAIAALHSNVKYFSIVNDIVVAFSETIDNAPTIDAEPIKRGTWTITETYDCEGGEIPHLICSECKSEPMAWSSKRFFNYCPNCGAKMKGQEE